MDKQNIERYGKFFFLSERLQWLVEWFWCFLGSIFLLKKNMIR
jgi:hypothetical protein